MSRAFVILLGAAAGCSPLGPMPATTGTTPIPAPRPGVELEAGAMPGYFLSKSVQERPGGDTFGQLAAILDLGALVGLPGAIVGGRYVGKPEQGGYLEPMIGYRRFLDEGENISAAAVAYGGRASGEENGASYEATRGGLELSADLQVTPPSRWLELHVFGGGSLTALSADGSYCVDSDGFGIDCPESPDTPRDMARASASGVYPAAFVGAALATGRHLIGPFHGARLGLQVAAGSQPRIEGGEQQDAAGYSAVGLTLAVGLGAEE